MHDDPISRDELARRLREPVVLVGIGRRDAGDDGFGVMVAEKLADCANLTVIQAGAVPENFLGRIVGDDRESPPATVVLVDAADFGDAPGAVRWFSPRDLAVTHLGTHAASPAVAEYLEAHGCQVHLLCVQAERVGMGHPPSLACLRAVEAVSSALRRHFQARGRDASACACGTEG